MKKNKMGIICMVTGAVLIVSALFLLLYNRSEDKKAGRASGEIVTELKNDLSAKDEGIMKEEEFGEMPVVTVGGYNYIGYLTIPALNLELPVMAEWDYDRLMIAPCRQSGSVQDHDLVIAGHNFVSHFGKLSNLSVGDMILFTNMNGNTVEYSVGAIELLRSDQGEEMLHSEWDLTLYTCNYSGRERITIRANR